MNNSITKYLKALKVVALLLLVCVAPPSFVYAQTEESDVPAEAAEPGFKEFDLLCCKQYCDAFPPERRNEICKSRCWQLESGSPCYLKYERTEDCEKTFNGDCRSLCDKYSKDANLSNDPMFQELLKVSTVKTCKDPKKSTYQANLDAAENAKIAACKTTLTIECLNQLDRCRKSPEDTYCKDVTGAAGSGWVAAKPAIEAKVKELITACLVDLKDPLCLEITNKCKENKALYESCDREWGGGQGFMAVANKLEQNANISTDIEKAMEAQKKAKAELDAQPAQ